MLGEPLSRSLAAPVNRWPWFGNAAKVDTVTQPELPELPEPCPRRWSIRIATWM